MNLGPARPLGAAKWAPLPVLLSKGVVCGAVWPPSLSCPSPVRTATCCISAPLPDLLLLPAGLGAARETVTEEALTRCVPFTHRRSRATRSCGPSLEQTASMALIFFFFFLVLFTLLYSRVSFYTY